MKHSKEQAFDNFVSGYLGWLFLLVLVAGITAGVEVRVHTSAPGSQIAFLVLAMTGIALLGIGFSIDKPMPQGLWHAVLVTIMLALAFVLICAGFTCLIGACFK
jgi:hypothetical protein